MNKKDQFKRFIKKDGFYVVLFVCLCLVATVGVVVANKSTNNTVEENIAENTIENTEDNSTTTGNTFDDAELVEGKTDIANDSEEIASNEANGEEVKPEANNADNSVATSSQSQSFTSPIKGGVITRLYNLEPRLNESGQSASVYKGIDIEAAEGTEVLAIGDGKVVEAGKGNSKEGCFVKIEHQNGIVGFYGNLDPLRSGRALPAYTPCPAARFFPPAWRPKYRANRGPNRRTARPARQGRSRTATGAKMLPVSPCRRTIRSDICSNRQQSARLSPPAR